MHHALIVWRYLSGLYDHILEVPVGQRQLERVHCSIQQVFNANRTMLWQ